MKRSIEVCRSKALRAEKSLLQGSFGLACIAAVMLALVTFPLKADESNAPEEVGRVTLVIGQAFAHNKNGEQRPLKRGDAVYVNESIETSTGGHVHLRFVDEGTVSLRPNSRLNIELYHYDKLQPKNSAIRFNLEAGVVRSISGKATQAAHDRFRLNTPITAIGVLGTDFVVRAEPEKMWAGVYSGAIAISPLNAQCAASGLGPCAGATRLSEAMGSVMIEFSGGKEREKIVPLDSAIISKSNSDKGLDKPTDSMPVASGRMNAAEIKAADVATQLGGVPQDSQPVQQPTPPDPVVAQPNPFAWARWGSQLPGDTMSQAYQTAQTGRTITVGNRYYALFRAPTALTELEPHAGVYDFKLQQGQAQFISNRSQNVEAARLDAASLQVDFGQRQFNTHLEMSHPSAGSAVLDEGGQIGSNGVFAGGNAVSGSGVAGALSTDGAYANMLFRKEVESGTFVGITDWAKK
ncbi:MAG: FecR family protein [Methylobacter sp.]